MENGEARLRRQEAIIMFLSSRGNEIYRLIRRKYGIMGLNRLVNLVDPVQPQQADLFWFSGAIDECMRA